MFNWLKKSKKVSLKKIGLNIWENSFGMKFTRIPAGEFNRTTDEI